MDINASAEKGPYPELARLITKILRAYQPSVSVLSTRIVCRKLGMSHDTVAGMAAGHRPPRSVLIEFAAAMRTSADELLKAADYPLLPGQAM